MSGRGAEREGDTELEASSRFWAVSTEPDTGLKLTNCEIMTWAEVGRLTDWATQAPLLVKSFEHALQIEMYVFIYELYILLYQNMVYIVKHGKS